MTLMPFTAVRGRLQSVILVVIIGLSPVVSRGEDKSTSDNSAATSPQMECIVATSELGWNGLGICSEHRFVFVNEWGSKPKGLYLSRGKSDESEPRPFSVSTLFTDPENVVEVDDGFFVTNNGTGSRLLFVRKNGGIPLPFSPGRIAPPEFFDEGPFINPFGMRAAGWIINPYGIVVAPSNYRGENVSPGDLIVFDNAHGRRDRSVIWAINPKTAEAKKLANADMLPGTFLLGTFSQSGALYAVLNASKRGGITILKIDASGEAEIVLENFAAIPAENAGKTSHEGIAAHPASDDLYFSIYGDVYVMKTTDYVPREIAKGGYILHHCSADGRSLYLQGVNGALSLWRLELPVSSGK